MSASFQHDALLEERQHFIQSLQDGEEPLLADQLSLLSHSYEEQYNIEMALIMAVAALEAAVFIFARNRLEPTLGRQTENYLRTEGIFKLVETLPQQWFSTNNRPDAKVLGSVKHAITARNNIMHGKVDRTGKPKHLNMGHLGTSIIACRRLREAFMSES